MIWATKGRKNKTAFGRALLLPLLALLALTAATPSPATTNLSKTRVWGFELENPRHDGAVGDLSQRIRPENRSARLETASGSPLATGGGAQNIANGVRLAKQLRFQEAASIFTKSGGLRADVIADSQVAMQGSKLLNQSLIQKLTSYGGNIADWAKMTTKTFNSPSGPFQVHFYQNLKTGLVYYGDDFKVVFNHQGVW